MKQIVFCAVLIIILGLMSGCSSSTSLQLHVKSAVAVRQVLNESKRIIEADMEKRAVAAAKDPNVPDPYQSEINAHTVMRQYDEIIIAHQTVVAAYEVWVTGILHALDHDDTEDRKQLLASLLRSVISAYEKVIAAAGKLALKIPYIDEVTDFIYGN